MNDASVAGSRSGTAPHDWQAHRTVKIVIAIGWAGWLFLRLRSIDFHGSMRIIEETL